MMQFALLIFESPEAFAARNGDENDPYLGAWRAYYKGGLSLASDALFTPSHGVYGVISKTVPPSLPAPPECGPE
jgi:hypothetical protein